MTEPILTQARRHAVGAELDAIDRGRQPVKDRIATMLKTEGARNDDATSRIVGDVVDTIADGRDLPTDLRKRIDREHQAKAARDREYTVLQDVDNALSADRQRIIENSTDAALGFLDTKLHDLLDHVARLSTDLDGVSSDTDAIRGNDQTIAAWRELNTLTTQYRELRAAQITLTGVGQAQNIAAAGITRIPCDPRYLVAVGAAQAITSAVVGAGVSYSPEPWPGFYDGTTDTPAYLRWLASRGDAWVPTTQQLQHALEARAVAVDLRTPIEDLARLDNPRVGSLRHLDNLDVVAAR